MKELVLDARKRIEPRRRSDVAVAATPARTQRATGPTAPTEPSVLDRLTVPFEGEDLELTNSARHADAIVESVYRLRGRAGLASITDHVADRSGPRGTPERFSGRARLPLTRQVVSGMGGPASLVNPRGAVRVSASWEEAVARFEKLLAGQLVEIEERAAEIALLRLGRSRETVLLERARYFTGLPPATVDDRRLPLGGGTLTPGGAASLRSFIVSVASARQTARESLAEFEELVRVTTAWPRGDRVTKKIGDARSKVLVDTAAIHKLVASAAKVSPALFWITDWSVDPVVDLDRHGGNDAVLYARTSAVLQRCWKASWTMTDRMRSQRPAGSVVASVRPHIDEVISDSIPDEDEAGPWRFPVVVREALADLGWTSYSTPAVATDRIMADAGLPWNQSLAFAAGSVALGIAARRLLGGWAWPVELAIDAVDLVASMAQFEIEAEEFQAVLDQSSALRTNPSGEVPAATLVAFLVANLDIGRIAAKGDVGILEVLLANVLPVAVQAWAPEDEGDER